MRETSKIVARLIDTFVKNYNTRGDIWGIDIPTWQLECGEKPSENAGSLVLATKEITIRAVKEAIFEFLLKEELDILDSEILASDEFRKFVENRLDRNLEPYLTTIRNLEKLVRLHDTLAFSYANFSLAPELLYFDPNIHKSLIKPVLEEIKALPGNEIFVYDPLEYYALKPYEKFIEKKVGYALEVLNNKTSVAEKFVVKEPCLLTRKFGFDLRRTIGRLLDNLIFHPLSGNLTVCCGEFMWFVAPKIAFNNAREILRMLSHYSRRILVICPSAAFLFKIAKLFDDELKGIEIRDLLDILAR